MRNVRALLRRPRWLSRPVAVLAAVLVGLGGLGGATGALLGELGGARSAGHMERGQSAGHDARLGHLGNLVDRDGNDGAPGPGGSR